MTHLQLFIVVLFLGCSTGQDLSSPCPNVFEYRRDRTGEIYGYIEIYSSDQNIIELNVQMSVGNAVKNYNGHIGLETPKGDVLTTIQQRMPIKYNVFFPRWENMPPKIIKIVVNGEVLCTGPPFEHNGWFRVITTVTLQHRFTISVAPLRPRVPFVNNNPFGRPQNNFVPPINNNNIANSNNNPFAVSVNIQDENGDRDVQDTGDFLDFYFTTTTTPRPTTTTRRPLVNDLLFPQNPFLNGNKETTSVRRSPQDASDNFSEICGVPLVPNPLIVNGQQVPTGAYPWLAAMFASTGIGVEYKCSGSLITNRHIITAAHCLTQHEQQIPPSKLLFLLGKLNIENLLLQDGERMAGAQEIKIHPDYIPFNSDADIAVVVLSSSLQFSKVVRPICLWEGNDALEGVIGEKGKVVGWGRNEENKSMTTAPRQVTMPVVSQETCLRASVAFKNITSRRTFCAGDRDDKGPCNGDSGSGFIMKRNGRWFLRGIVSISIFDPIKSCDLSQYVVFTDVSKFRKWLYSIIVI